MEEWKDIKGYEGYYQISNFGRVKSLPRDVGSDRCKKESIMKTSLDKDGYENLVLRKNGKQRHFRVNRLVAEAFLENPNNYPQVNHKDEDKTNNNVNNLEWCSAKYNVNYGSRTEKASKKVICVTTGKIFKSIAEASKYYNLKGNHISACCKGKLKSCGKHPITGEKLVWKYL